MIRLLLMSCLLLGTLGAVNWPQWRGPKLDGTSTETGLPVKWSATGNIAWKLALPERSGSTPIIWGDVVFLNVAAGQNIELWTVDRRSGSVLWKRQLDTGNHRKQKHNMSSPSPVTDGRTVWVMTGTGALKAFDFFGTELWARNIQKDYGQFGLNWGYGSSPLLYQGDLIIQVLHGMLTDDPSYLLRVDGKTGKTKWRVERPTKAIAESPDSYTTPQLIAIDGKDEIVITGGDVITGHDPATGRELWRGAGFNPTNHEYHRIIASAVVRDNLIYAPTRVRPLIVYRGGGRGDVTATHQAWQFDNGPDVPTPVVDEKYFYSINDRGIAWCLDAKTGKEVYGGKRLRPGTYSSSPVLADGKIYITNEDGVTSVLKAGPEFEILAENETNEYALSSIAVSNGQLFLRTENHLYCIGKK
jgi:outer membrane protein assembly factor BamB